VTGRALLGVGLSAWLGTTLLLSQLRWCRRVSLAERLRPYAPGGMARHGGAGFLMAGSLREALGSLARSIGARAARAVGVHEEAGVRLRRVHSHLDVTEFRLRQVGASVVALGSAGLVGVALGFPAPLLLGLLLVAPALAFLLLEQQLSGQSARWQRSLFLELPVVAEQLALLLAAGWSLTAALNRLAERGTGVAAVDLRRVSQRVRQGLPETAALREWAQVAQVPALDRLVAVLALNRETGDLGRLISEEARSVRRDAHRELIEAAERRNQQVWIPVTVAALVPGVLFMAIPFVAALRLFGG
jgi:tight adherence protein C